MPELPEVETVRRGLASLVVGKVIRKISFFWHKVPNIPSDTFNRRVKDAQIREVKRRAKILIIELSNSLNVLIHLKMTGQLLYRANMSGSEKHERHVRALIYFNDGSGLMFKDIRKFGYIRLVTQEELKNTIGKEKIGPEPLLKSFTFTRFNGIIEKYPGRKIKQLLTDQSVIAGIGNIYADEICFYAKVLPTKPAGELSEKQRKSLWRGMKRILKDSIRMGGTSINTYVDIAGKKGSYAKKLKVYGKKGKKCYKCSGKIKRISLGGRRTYFCPDCQF